MSQVTLIKISMAVEEILTKLESLKSEVDHAIACCAGTENEVPQVRNFMDEAVDRD